MDRAGRPFRGDAGTRTLVDGGEKGRPGGAATPPARDRPGAVFPKSAGESIGSFGENPTSVRRRRQRNSQCDNIVDERHFEPDDKEP